MRLSFSALACLGALGACSDDGVGVELCRRIETARCHAAAACGEISDSAECARFYRDQCLHGFSGTAPSEREATSCVDALESVTECARSETCDPVCDAAQTPAVLPACAFLSEEDPDDAEDPEPSGGAGGGGDQPAGASGAAGASD